MSHGGLLGFPSCPCGPEPVKPQSSEPVPSRRPWWGEALPPLCVSAGQAGGTQGWCSAHASGKHLFQELQGRGIHQKYEAPWRLVRIMGTNTPSQEPLWEGCVEVAGQPPGPRVIIQGAHCKQVINGSCFCFEALLEKAVSDPCLCLGSAVWCGHCTVHQTGDSVSLGALRNQLKQPQMLAFLEVQKFSFSLNSVM